MTYIFGNWLKNAKIFENRLNYLGNGLKISQKGLNMWEITYIFGNWLKCLRNG